MLRQPTMECNPQVVGEIAHGPKPHLFDDHSLVGFNVLVPRNREDASTQKSGVHCPSVSRDVPRLLGTPHGPSPLAPPLHHFVREALEAKQVSPSAIESFLATRPSLVTYDLPFRVLWTMCQREEVSLLSSPIVRVASVLIKLHNVSPSQARQAYSALLMVPGLDQLRFCPLLQPFRKLWFTSNVRYGGFWNPLPLFKKLAMSHVKWDDIQQVRDRLIIVLRLLHLMRSFDLSQVMRKVCFIDDAPMVWLKRKGWKEHRWVEVLRTCSRCAPSSVSSSSLGMFSSSQMCPWCLLKRYVHLTSGLVPQGSSLFRSLRSPFPPLSANAIGSVTKKIFGFHGIDA